MSRSIALVSLGCAKNAADLEVMAGNLVKKGYSLSPDPGRADIVIVNTCAFLKAAREEAEAEIRRAVEMKRAGRYSKVVVAGCYPQRYPDAASRFPGVDEWLGVPGSWVEPKMPALRFTGKAYAYLKIAEGCSHRCAYCAIPSIRGPYRSRPTASIMREARSLLATGCRELNIVAQDPMPWRDGKKGLVDLLRALDAIEGDFWIRVLYSYPSEISDEYLEWLATSSHAVRYADVPIQHTVPEVLRRMNRGAAIPATLAVAERLRTAVGGIALRTTVLTGFPGETEARFERLLADLKRMRFDHLGAFAYSPEKGTAGFSMAGRPSKAVAERRLERVMAVQRRIWGGIAKSMAGRVYRALVVAPGVARLESQAPDVDGVVHVDGGDVGEFVEVRIVARRGFDFEGEVLDGRS